MGKMYINFDLKCFGLHTYWAIFSKARFLTLRPTLVYASLFVDRLFTIAEFVLQHRPLFVNVLSFRYFLQQLNKCFANELLEKASNDVH
jgi:hypothetical protein